MTKYSQNKSIEIISTKIKYKIISYVSSTQPLFKQLIAISRLRQDASLYPDVKKQVENWYKIVKNAQWKNLEEVKKIYKNAEAVGNFTVFNLKGNHYRLIVGINYEAQVIYYKYFLSHREYDKNDWKNDPYF